MTWLFYDIILFKSSKATLCWIPQFFPSQLILIMKSIKDFMEQQQHGFSDSTPRAGSDILQKLAKSLQ